MKEPIFNLFVFEHGGIISEIGVVVHERDGSDDDKTAFLQEQVNTDYPKAEHFPVPKNFWMIDVETGQKANLVRPEVFMQLADMGKQLELFEEIFDALNAPANPIFCITLIVNGKPRIETVRQF